MLEQHQPLAILQSPTGIATLLVTNLPIVLFWQAADLEPLFYPFGEVKKIERLPSSPSSSASYSPVMSVVVTDASASSAQEAKNILHGQVYADQILCVEFITPSGTSYGHASGSFGTGIGPAISSGKLLNPRASPFVCDTASSLSAPPTCSLVEPRFDYFGSLKPVSAGMATPQHLHNATSPPTFSVPFPAGGLPSRTSSAASWYVDRLGARRLVRQR